MLLQADVQYDLIALKVHRNCFPFEELLTENGHSCCPGFCFESDPCFMNSLEFHQ